MKDAIIYSPNFTGLVSEITTTQLTALKKKDVKLWEQINEIRSKMTIEEPEILTDEIPTAEN